MQLCLQIFGGLSQLVPHCLDTAAASFHLRCPAVSSAFAALDLELHTQALLKLELLQARRRKMLLQCLERRVLTRVIRAVLLKQLQRGVELLLLDLDLNARAQCRSKARTLRPRLAALAASVALLQGWGNSAHSVRVIRGRIPARTSVS